MDRRVWMIQQDQALKKLVNEIGPTNWAFIARQMNKQLPGIHRNGKQCRQRWLNHLQIADKKIQWQQKDIESLVDLHQKYGNKWTKIAKEMPGRTENSIKTFYHSNLRKGKKILKQSNRTKLSNIQKFFKECETASYQIQNLLRKIIIYKTLLIGFNKHQQPLTQQIDSTLELLSSYQPQSSPQINQKALRNELSQQNLIKQQQVPNSQCKLMFLNSNLLPESMVIRSDQFSKSHLNYSHSSFFHDRISSMYSNQQHLLNDIKTIQSPNFCMLQGGSQIYKNNISAYFLQGKNLSCISNLFTAYEQ